MRIAGEPFPVGARSRAVRRALDLSYAEAAEVCDCPVGAIGSRVARAREDLVAAMQERPGERGRAGGT